MKARVQWLDGAAFVAETGSGHGLVIDGPESIGGRNIGPRPMELILLGLVSCSAVDMVHILGRARQPVDRCEVLVNGTRADTDPKVFTDIELEFVVHGAGLKTAQVERAARLSAEKYCSASLMLQASVNITHKCTIYDTAADHATA